MAEKQMAIQVEFPTWSELSRPVKSLMNFLMEGAITHIIDANGMISHWESESTDIEHASAWISQLSYSDSARIEPEYYRYENTHYNPEMSIFYVNQDEPIDISATTLDYGRSYKYNFESTFTPCKTYIGLYYTSDIENMYSYEELDYTRSLIPSNLTVPVNISCLIDGVKNTNTNVVIKNADYSKGIHKVNNQEFECDYQLRTSSFAIVNVPEYSGDITGYKDLYFKVGICPVEVDGYTAPTIDECIELLKNSKFKVTFATDTSYIAGIEFYINSINMDLPHIFKDVIFSQLDSSYDGESNYYDLGTYPSHYTVFIEESQYYGDYDYNTTPKLFMLYFKLYNEDGTPEDALDFAEANTHFEDGYAFIGGKESNGWYVIDSKGCDVSLHFTDESIDGGYVEPNVQLMMV